MVYINRSYNFKLFKGCLPQILLGPLSKGLMKVTSKGWKCKFYVILPDNLLGFTSSALTKYISFSSLDERTITIYSYQTRTFGCPLGTNIVIKNATYGYNNCYLPINKTIARIKLNCKNERCTDIQGRDEFFNATLSCDKTLEDFFFWRVRLTVKYTCVQGKFFDEVSVDMQHLKSCIVFKSVLIVVLIHWNCIFFVNSSFWIEFGKP